ncbi:hypothetical protein QUA42_02635 [Microcoleus sp. Pol11C2]|uniref:hypothetical protein n=1 Tax=Microcoleus sp. Pol11C2 TaxID=3055389 RepID=UPI002FD0F677
MLQELYLFDWNTTDKRIQHQQNSDSEELERMWWEDTDEIFNTWENIAAAVLCTYRLIRAIVLAELFLMLRRFVRIASKVVWINPALADRIGNWGEEVREPWSLALIHEEFITK